MTAAIILAAGASTRLGIPKQLVLLDAETLLDRAVRIANEARCSPVIVVLGANAALIEQGCSLHNATMVHNERWSEGMGSSLLAGLAAIPQSSGAIVMTCDMPAVTSAHLRTLASSGGLTASRYASRNGVPAYFPRTSFRALSSLKGDTGARALLSSAFSVDLQNGEWDIDTPADLEKLALPR